MTPLRNTTWRLPISLILLTILPIAASLYRLVDLVITDPASVSDPDILRFFNAPSPIALHVAFGSLFLLLGSLQLSPGLRTRHRILHKRLGYAAALSALVFAISGVLMVFFAQSVKSLDRCWTGDIWKRHCGLYSAWRLVCRCQEYTSTSCLDDPGVCTVSEQWHSKLPDCHRHCCEWIV